jgi:hypothetical protein
VSAFHAAVGGMVTAAGVGMVMVGRNWPAPSGARRSRQVSDASLMDDLLGPDSYWTTIPEHAPGVIRQAFNDCPACQQTTAGVVTRDGWTCGQCFTPTTHTARGGAL